MKKILALCLALTMALAVFAGCSGAASSSAPAAGSASGSASTGGSASGKQLSGKVVYWSMYNEGEPEAMAIQKAADMFMEDYPDCEVEIQWIGRSNQDITGPALEGGEQLDILDNFSYDKSTDRYLDITDMMNGPALGQEDMTVAESILPVLNLANAQGQEKAGLETDKYYGVQMFPWVVGFFYNKDLFQQAGITETPETWTEFMEACQKLKDAGINAVTCDDAYMTLIPNNYLARLVGSDTIAAMSASASDPAWQSEEVKQAFAAMETLSPFMSPQTATNKYPAGQQEFALGEAAMYLNASWMPSEVADTAGEDFPWGFFAFPQVEDGAEGSGYVSVGGVPPGRIQRLPEPRGGEGVPALCGVQGSAGLSGRAGRRSGDRRLRVARCPCRMHGCDRCCGQGGQPELRPFQRVCERSVYNGDEQGAHPADDGRQGGIHPDGRSFQILTPAG